MGRTTPTKKSTARPKAPVGQEASSAQVLQMVERLGGLLMAYRQREGLDQKEMAELMGIGQSRYNEIEKNRNLNPDFGVSLAFLLRFAGLEKTTFGALATLLQGQSSGSGPKRNQIDEEFLAAFSGVKLDDRVDLVAVSKQKPDTDAIADRMKWLIELGLDIFALDAKEQLELEVRIHQTLLKDKNKSRLSLDERRARLTAVLRKIIELS